MFVSVSPVGRVKGMGTVPFPMQPQIYLQGY